MQASEPEVEKRRRRPLRRISFGALGLLMILALAVGGLAVQATRDSLSLDILRGPVEAALRARLPANASVSIGSAAVSYRPGEGILLKGRDVRLSLPGKATVTAAELSTVTTPAALARGHIELSSVAVTGVEIGVSTPPGLERSGSAAEFVRRAATIFMQQVLAIDDLMRATGLSEVVVRDASVRMLDRGDRLGPALRISEANWLPLGIGRSKAWLQVVEPDGAGWDLTVERQRGRLGSASVSVEIEDVPVATLAPGLADADGGPLWVSTITLQARLAAGRDGSLSGIRGVLSTGNGLLAFAGDNQIRIAGTALRFALGPTGDRLEIPSGEIRTEGGSMRFEGSADLSNAESVGVVGRLRGGALPTQRADQPSVRLTGGDARLKLDLRNLTIDIERVNLATPDGSASVIGQASLGGAAPGLSLALSVSEMPAATLRALWPPFVAKKSRNWFDDNVVSGRLGPATLRVALPPDFIGPRGRGKVLPDYALLGSVPIRDAVFSPLRTFPKISQVAGEIAFAAGAVTMQAQSGIVTMPGKGDLQVAGSTLVIPQLGLLKPRGELHLELSGPVSALAALSDTPPLKVAVGQGIVADELTGGAQLSLDVNLPLYPNANERAEPDFHLAVSDFSSKSAIKEHTIADADLVLEGTPKSFTMTGEGTMDGMQAAIDLILGTEVASQSDVSVTLDEAARKRLGLTFGGLVTGPIQASMKSLGEGRQSVALDLKAARISFPFLGWEKGKGVPATAQFVMEKTDGQTRVTDLVVSGKGFKAKGSLTVGANGLVRQLQLDEVALRPGDRLSLTATAKDRGYEVRVGGAALDARGIIRSIGADSDTETEDIFPIRIALDVDDVTGENDIVLSNVVGSLVVTEKGLDSASLKGAAGRGEPFEWKLGKDGKTRNLHVSAENGGALIRFGGVYTKISGGKLALDYSGVAGGGGNGVFTLQDFRLIEETALVPALEAAVRRPSAVNDVGDVRARVAASSGDLNFTQLTVPFRQEGWVIAVEDAALRGSMLGATGGGTINIPGGKIAVSGTFIPAFGINNIAGAIPLFGAILGGGRDEGLVGITYKLYGPLKDPALTMNPISAIAPGIFRKLFEYR